MKNTLLGAVLLLGMIVIGLTGIALANSAVDGDQPAMMVSPSVIVLAKVDTITVHTNIAATAVDTGSLALDGAAPTSVGVDDLGHITAKFAVADLGLSPGVVRLTLTGAFTDGGAFSASDTVRVR
ncbi:MAG: hypothetical protein ACYDCO_01340 [Armatimonadota bacterium]